MAKRGWPSDHHPVIEMKEPRSTPTPKLPSTAVDDALRLRRNDLAALIDSYIQDSRGPRQWALAGVGLCGLALGRVLVILGQHYGWPVRLEHYFLLGSCAITLGCFAIILRRDMAMRRRYRFNCPACDTVLWKGWRNKGALARAELVIRTGNCPHCGSNILAP